GARRTPGACSRPESGQKAPGPGQPRNRPGCQPKPVRFGFRWFPEASGPNPHNPPHLLDARSAVLFSLNRARFATNPKRSSSPDARTGNDEYRMSESKRKPNNRFRTLSGPSGILLICSFFPAPCFGVALFACLGAVALEAEFDAAPFALPLPAGDGLMWEDPRELHKDVDHFRGP